MDKKTNGKKETKSDKGMKRILIVEDDPFLSDIYYTKLKETDFETDMAYTGDECWQKLKEKKYDLMVLDIVLPGMDGWEIMAKIREIRENGGPEGEYMENLKIIILSNLGLKEEIQKGLRLGADSFLLKAHFTPTQVVEEIIKIIK
ncbi:MAG TPA: response regulator [Candidatus Paceibacterota bacterium]|nr:response regulator [Candidatus Pacearchaeota archaeon]HRZ50882.1 response regulator [Candidatus Paceibacterota bacterium]HSA36603.1 response regulator [Candidatus Paceibacterota bacterium]